MFQYPECVTQESSRIIYPDWASENGTLLVLDTYIIC